MKACKCGSHEFYARQVCRLDIIVDESNCFLKDIGPEGHTAIYDAETPYGPYTCTECGAEYESLDELYDIVEEEGKE